jgi:hypothetical protein
MVDLNFLQALSCYFPVAYPLALFHSRMNRSSKMPVLRGGIGTLSLPLFILFTCGQYALARRLVAIDHMV